MGQAHRLLLEHAAHRRSAPPRCTSSIQPRIVSIISLEVVRQFIFGCSGPVLWSMMADVADYGEWKTGRRATGAAISGVVFALWVGVALGGAIAAWLLSFFGYVSDAKVQTARAQLGIQLTPSVFAGLAFLGAAVCLCFYPDHPRTESQDRQRANRTPQDLRSASKLVTPHPYRGLGTGNCAPRFRDL